MQENRSFDSYFGTFPGADGLLRNKEGQFTECVPDPRKGGCDQPYHDRADQTSGGDHLGGDEARAVDGGKMDGFIAVAEQDGIRDCTPIVPSCNGTSPPDVMGYHDGADIPNYWAYARHFVLQDHMFSPSNSYSLAAHLYLVSGWSASCSRANDPATCVNDADPATSDSGPFAWAGPA